MGQYLDVLDTRLMPRVLVEHDPTFALQSRKDGWGQGRCQTRAWRGLAANACGAWTAWWSPLLA